MHFLQGNIPIMHLLYAKLPFMSSQRSAFNEVNNWAHSTKITKIEHCFRDINVIARVANSTRKIKISKFKQFCTDAYVFKIKAFDWPSLTVSLHRAYGHLPEIISLNDGLGLGDVSETCLESSHKVLRYASKHLGPNHLLL